MLAMSFLDFYAAKSWTADENALHLADAARILRGGTSIGSSAQLPECSQFEFNCY